MPDEPGRAASPAPSAGRAAKVPRGSLLGSSQPASPSAAAPKRCGASLPRRRGEPVRPSPVAASPSEPGLAAWRLSTAGGRAGARRSVQRRAAEGLSRPDCLPSPEALGRPIQPLGRRRARRRGGHRVRGQRRRPSYKYYDEHYIISNIIASFNNVVDKNLSSWRNDDNAEADLNSDF
uniref:Uncharacterized protein n=1 Tax=Sphaerodactylus townsendi TaxID=933632 RepID=A0ACB8E7G5_9SAUR